MTLDFSEFHPLDHWPFSQRCKEFYGGGFHHLSIAWHYHRKEQIGYYLKRPFYKILCKFGKHDTKCWHISSINRYQIMCRFCDFKRGARDDEIFPIPDFKSMKVIGLADEEEE